VRFGNRSESALYYWRSSLQYGVVSRPGRLIIRVDGSSDLRLRSFGVDEWFKRRGRMIASRSADG